MLFYTLGRSENVGSAFKFATYFVRPIIIHELIELIFFVYLFTRDIEEARVNRRSSTSRYLLEFIKLPRLIDVFVFFFSNVYKANMYIFVALSSIEQINQILHLLRLNQRLCHFRTRFFMYVQFFATVNDFCFSTSLASTSNDTSKWTEKWSRVNIYFNSRESIYEFLVNLV